MNIIRLNYKHKEAVQDLFSLSNSRYMGSGEFINQNPNWHNRMFEIFCDTYLSDLDHYHAFGAFDETTNRIEAFISFYEDINEPSWFLTSGRSFGNNFLLKDILDVIMEYNESKGRLKFFTVANRRQMRLMRKLGFSERAQERYDYFDEYIINPREKPFYNDHWEILYRRRLLLVETVVRCTFLKKEYRTILPNGGNI